MKETEREMTTRKSEELKDQEVEFLHVMERVQESLRRRANKKRLEK